MFGHCLSLFKLWLCVIDSGKHLIFFNCVAFAHNNFKEHARLSGRHFRLFNKGYEAVMQKRF